MFEFAKQDSEADLLDNFSAFLALNKMEARFSNLLKGLGLFDLLSWPLRSLIRLQVHDVKKSSLVDVPLKCTYLYQRVSVGVTAYDCRFTRK